MTKEWAASLREEFEQKKTVAPPPKAQAGKAGKGGKGGKAKGMAQAVIAYLKAHPNEMKAIVGGTAMGALTGGAKGAAMGLAAGAVLGRQPQANTGLNDLLAQGPTGPQDRPQDPYVAEEAQGMTHGPTGPQGGSAGGFSPMEASAPPPSAPPGAPPSAFTPEDRRAFQARHDKRMADGLDMRDQMAQLPQAPPSQRGSGSIVGMQPSSPPQSIEDSTGQIAARNLIGATQPQQPAAADSTQTALPPLRKRPGMWSVP